MPRQRLHGGTQMRLKEAIFLLDITGVCPQEVNEVIYGWGQYSDNINSLRPSSEKDKIDYLANLVVTSFAATGCAPLGKIEVVGHADKDFHGENFEKSVSNERALTVAAALSAAIIKLWKERESTLGHFKKGAIAFDPPPHGVGATQPDKDGANDRTKNRRVEVKLSPRGAPIPPPPPDPDTETAQRVSRCVELLGKRSMPGGPVQTQRVRCMFNKLKSNPNVNDRFVDGDLTIVQIRGKLVNGLQDINRNYGNLTAEEREVFWQRAKPVILNVPGFSQTASDDDVIREMDRLDRRILKAIGFIDAHLGINGIASDATKVILNDEISKLQGDPNSIYSCK